MDDAPGVERGGQCRSFFEEGPAGFLEELKISSVVHVSEDVNVVATDLENDDRAYVLAPVVRRCACHVALLFCWTAEFLFCHLNRAPPQ